MVIMGWLATGMGARRPNPGSRFIFGEIRRFPMLEPHEEYVLAKRWREHGDHEAAHKLVNSHLRLIVKIAMRFCGYGLPKGRLKSPSRNRTRHEADGLPVR
jgi:RNA polymerase sigma-32 factor